MFYRWNPANNNRNNPRAHKEQKPEINAYPRAYWEGDGPPVHTYGKPVYTTAYLQRLGWCMECKENPCECVQPGDEWIDPD